MPNAVPRTDSTHRRRAGPQRPSASAATAAAVREQQRSRIADEPEPEVDDPLVEPHEQAQRRPSDRGVDAARRPPSAATSSARPSRIGPIGFSGRRAPEQRADAGEHAERGRRAARRAASPFRSCSTHAATVSADPEREQRPREARSSRALPQPQRDVGGLHRLAHDRRGCPRRASRGRARRAAARRTPRACAPRRSGGGRSGGRRRLDPRPRRAEERRDRQRRHRDREAGLADREPDQQHERRGRSRASVAVSAP